MACSVKLITIFFFFQDASHFEHKPRTILTHLLEIISILISQLHKKLLNHVVFYKTSLLLACHLLQNKNQKTENRKGVLFPFPQSFHFFIEKVVMYSSAVTCLCGDRTCANDLCFSGRKFLKLFW
jgi:hypothetical protein